MKRNNILLSAFLSIITFISFASAAYFPDVRSLSQSVIDSYVSVGEPILQALFGGYGGWSGYLLFERFLLFILLISIIYVVMGRISLFEEKKSVKWIISIIIPLIAIRYMDYVMIETILFQYTFLSIILSSILPFLIFFFFIRSLGADYPILRKIGWLLFIGIYAGLWSTASGDSQSMIFFWTFIAAILVLIFDKRIDMWLSAKEFAKRERWNINNKIAEINDRINKINSQVTIGSHPNPREARKEINELTLQRKYLSRQI